MNLPEGLFVSINHHSGKVWLSVHSGGSAVLPLTAEQAEELGLKMFRMARKMKRGE